MNEEYVIGKIRKLLPEPQHAPTGVLYTKLKNEVQRDISDILSKLFKERRITYSKTLNDILINLTNE